MSRQPAQQKQFILHCHLKSKGLALHQAHNCDLVFKSESQKDRLAVEPGLFL